MPTLGCRLSIRSVAAAFVAAVAIGSLAPRATAAGCHLDGPPVLGLDQVVEGDPIAILGLSTAEPSRPVSQLGTTPCSGQTPAGLSFEVSSIPPVLFVDARDRELADPGQPLLGGSAPALDSRLAGTRLDRPPRSIDRSFLNG